ncbi:AcrR family transcriptional regulator [Nakamurella sp. UYEF19]|uniref:TetR/AcrR family transcriptional regulator n=1 Tax=Nakamurella sp. UYEF19 TaxID=1756392 RepID=UPI003391BD6D
MDPRARRTRDMVMDKARLLLAERGVDGLTFSSVGKAAGVSRQTLYRHWATREQLINDVAVTINDLGSAPTPNGSAESHLRAFLMSMRDLAQAPAMESAGTQLVANAASDADSAGVLRDVMDDRIAVLSTGWGPVGDDEYALMVGPLMFRMLVLRGTVTDEFIDTIVAEAMMRRVPTPGGQSLLPVQPVVT